MNESNVIEFVRDEQSEEDGAEYRELTPEESARSVERYENQLSDAKKERKPSRNAPALIGKTSRLIDSKTKVEIIRSIVTSLLLGKSYGTIITETTALYPISATHTKRMIKSARESIAKQAPDEAAKVLMDYHVQLRLQLIEESEHSRDKLEAAKDLARLQRLYDDKITIRKVTADDVPDHDLMAIAAGGNTQ